MADHVIHHDDRRSNTGTIIAVSILALLAILAALYFFSPTVSRESREINIDVPEQVNVPTPDTPDVPKPDINPVR